MTNFWQDKIITFMIKQLFKVSSQVDQINQSACDIANRVSGVKDTIVAAGVTQTGLFQGDGPKPSKQKVQDELRDALKIYKSNNIHLVIVEVS